MRGAAEAAHEWQLHFGSRREMTFKSALKLLRKKKVLHQHDERHEVLQQLLDTEVGVWDANQKVSLGS